jgi:hypothetical protein
MSLAQILGLGSPGSNSAIQAQLLSGLIAGSVTPPTLEELRLQQFAQPTDFQYLGDLTAEDLSPTELRNILTDPRLQQAQFETLDQLKQQIDQGGMTAIDRAQLNEIRAEQTAVDRGQREAILQQAAMRGLGGSGVSLAQQLQAQQASANTAAQQAAQVAAQAQQARQQAALQRAGLGAQMQAQSFGQQAQQAGAQDAINSFNVANRNAAKERNLNVRQGLSQQNTAQQNQVGQMNTQLANQANIYNTTQRPLQQYGMQSGQMAAIAGGLQNAGQMQNQNAIAQYGANAQLTGSALSALGQVGGAFAGRPPQAAATSDKRVKENIRESDDIDIDNFLKQLVPYRFKYKEDTGLPQNDRLGIMAQDLEKSRIGSEIVREDSDNVKNIDLMEAVPKILASLGYLNKKIDERTR